MVLQTVTLPRKDICPCEELYFRRCYGTVKTEPDRLTLELGDKVGFDTYFGCFYSDRWLRYTVVDSFSLGVRASGKARLTVLRRWVENGEFRDETVFEETVEFDENQSYYTDEIALEERSVYSFDLSPTGGRFSFLGAAYCTAETPTNDVRIAVAICTYKREQAVKKTLSMINTELLRKGSPLHGRLGVIVSDNAGTLGEHTTSDGSVRVVANRNVGGTGGFTRGIIEAVKTNAFTHILLADDDATLDPASLERAFVFLSLLREEHFDLTLGGALLREDIPWIQYEAGARWAGGPIEPVGHGLDLRRVADVLRNGANDEPIDYAGWWFCCIPVARMRAVGLPLPLFIHRDDVEYGLRCGKVTTLPGVCCWHEAFELKMTGTSEYYDVRNTAITNALHRPENGAAALTRYLSKRVTINLMTCRYKYARMNLRAVRDFLRGFDFLRDTDAEQLHRELMAEDYRQTEVSSLPGFSGVADFNAQFSEQVAEASAAQTPNILEGLKDKSLDVLSLGGSILPPKKETALAVQPSPVRRCFRAGRIIHCTVDRRGFEVSRDKDEQKRITDEYRELVALIKEKYDTVASEYRARSGEVRTMGYWRSVLGISK